MGSEMCIRDRLYAVGTVFATVITGPTIQSFNIATSAETAFSIPAWVCLLYTSDAADDMQCVDLGCRRIIKKKKKKNEFFFFKQKTAYFFFSSRRRHTR